MLRRFISGSSFAGYTRGTVADDFLCRSSVCGMANGSSSSSATLSSRRHLLVGCKENGVKVDSNATWTDIIGMTTVGTHRLAAGDLLGMMDLCASRVAYCHMKGGEKTTGMGKLSAATMSVTNTQFLTPVLHGDSMRMNGTVVHAGKSSIGVYIRTFRSSPSTRKESFCGESFFTMVAIKEDLKSAKVVPAVELTTPESIRAHERYNVILSSIHDSSTEYDRLSKIQLTPEEVDCPMNRAKPLHTQISSTTVRANRVFFSAHLNMHNSIFGGELMRWMEEHATHCARMFTGSRNVYTVGMHSVVFDSPIMASDWVSLTARVVYVRNSTMEVDVVLQVEKHDGDIVSNRAAFVIINTDDVGQPSPIPVGIELYKTTQEDLRAFAHAKWRYHRSAQRKSDMKAILAKQNFVA